MRILQVNKFLYPKGGDARVTLATGRLLHERGHDVAYWGMEDERNSDFPFKHTFVKQVDYHRRYSFFSQLKMASRIIYSFPARKKFEQVVLEFRPEVVHLHNFAHQISPSILQVCKQYKLPAIMTLHDYKLVCPVYTLYSGGRVCEKCRGGRFRWCLVKKCTQGSFLKSLVNYLEMTVHHRICSLYGHVDLFLSPSHFLKQKIMEMGFSGNIQVVPNFIELDIFTPSPDISGNGLCYFGRLSREKGLNTLIRAMEGIDSKLKVIGTGPEENRLRDLIGKLNISNVQLMGYLTGPELLKEIRQSQLVVVPSEWYENNPLSVLEAFALGKPVIGSRMGGITELIKPGVTGFLFSPASVTDLRETIRRALSDPPGLRQMGGNAREFVSQCCHPDLYYERLLNMYRSVISQKQ